MMIDTVSAHNSNTSIIFIRGSIGQYHIFGGATIRKLIMLIKRAYKDLNKKKGK